MNASPPRFVLAGGEDDADVAALHADSWRRTYRGILADGFLGRAVGDDRAAFWAARLSDPPAGRWVLLARSGEALSGFVCLELDRDPHWGSLVDNLHVALSARGTGLGKALLARAARHAEAAAAQAGGLYLWVYEDNAAARDFYAWRGGAEFGKIEEPVPGGGSARVVRVAWPRDRIAALGAAA